MLMQNSEKPKNMMLQRDGKIAKVRFVGIMLTQVYVNIRKYTWPSRKKIVYGIYRYIRL